MKLDILTGKMIGISSVSDGTVAGQLKIWDVTAAAWDNATLTAGTNTTITNADGSITIASSGGIADGTAAGQLKIWNVTTSAWDNATLTAGTNITVTNADGAITIDASGSPAESTGTLAAAATLNIIVLDTATSTSSDEVEIRIYDATSGFELSKKTTVFDTGNFTALVGGSSYAPADFTFATDASGTDIRLNITNNTANTVKYGYRLLNASTA